MDTTTPTNATTKRKTISMTLDSWNSLFNILAVLAAGFTFLVGAGALVTGNKLNKRQTERLVSLETELSRQKEQTAKAEREAADAKSIAGKAGEGTAKALERAAANEKEAAQLRKEAEAERLARVKIEEKLAPRRLSPDQLTELAAALKPFAGVRANFFAPTGDPEVIRLSNDILAALGEKGAGWVVTVSSGQQLGATIVGIVVELNDDADEQTKSAAAALIRALHSQRVDANGPTTPIRRGPSISTGRTDPLAKMRINVGAKR